MMGKQGRAKGGRNRIPAVIVFILFLFVHSDGFCQISQVLRFSGSPNPVGSGARALGMGGAFIGIADDATAASWNPGGLMQLDTPEVSMVLSYVKRESDRGSASTPGASGTESTDLFDLNYLSAAYPFNAWNRNMIVSLNYQTLFDFNREMAVSYFHPNDYPGPIGDRWTRRETDGYLKSLSPAFAVQITPFLSLGLTLNWFSEDLGSEWETSYRDRLVGSFGDLPYTHDVRYDEENTFDGVNFNLGVLWNATPRLTLGLVFKSPFDADVHHREVYSVEGTNPVPTTVILDEDQTLEMPASYGIGLAYRFSDAFSMDLDLYRTEWDDFGLRQADGTELSLFTGTARSETSTDPTHQVRLGAEYLHISESDYAIPIRAGLFYDPEPTAGEPDDFYGMSLGTGLAMGSFIFDIAFQYRWGNGVRSVRLLNERIDQDVKEATVYGSVIYHF